MFLLPRSNTDEFWVVNHAFSPKQQILIQPVGGDSSLIRRTIFVPIQDRRLINVIFNSKHKEFLALLHDTPVDGNANLYAIRINENGKRLNPEKRVASGFDPNNVGITWIADQYIIAYPRNGAIFVQQLDTDLKRRASHLQITSSPTLAAFHIQITTASENNRILITWRSSEKIPFKNYHIYGQMLGLTK
ncbi:hypothetical protein L0244_39090 [bacterium]|nr:hypothetical protein [bacterium]